MMRRSTFLRSMALTGGLLTRWRAAAQPSEQLTLEQVTGDIHILSGSGGNVAVLTTDEGVVLVDDKFDRNVEEILAKVRKLTDKPVRYVVSTHHHGDHTGGNPRLLGSAEIISHENARANMVKGSQPGPPRLTFSEGAAVYLGGKEVRTRHFGRGHTNGDAVVYYPAQKVIHFGDLLVEGTPFIDYANGGSGIAWTATLEQALQLDFETVIPGHGKVMKRADLVAWIDSFKTVRERIARMLREKRSKENILASLKVDDLTGWKPSQFWTQRSLPGLIDEMAR